MSTTTIISKDELLQHWLGHRSLTRKTIEKFPEGEFFTFKVGSMRTGAELIQEMITLAGPAMQSIATGESFAYSGEITAKTKEEFLTMWDETTPKLIASFNAIPEERFHQTFKLFGEYELKIIDHILYFIENEVHHRGQMFVYLRALDVEPPFFWDRF